MHKTTIDCIITEIGEADSIEFSTDIVFQHDGAPPHDPSQIWKYFENSFHSCWIGWPSNTFKHFNGLFEEKGTETKRAPLFDIRQEINIFRNIDVTISFDNFGSDI